MVVLFMFFTLVAVQTGIGMNHPEFFKASGGKTPNWHYVGAHECKSGKQKDGAYAIAVNGKVHFKQANEDGTVDKVSCDGAK